MGAKTKIEWTRGDDGSPGATWNPITGCTEISPGCDRCYAKTFAERWRGTPGHYFERGFDVQLRPNKLTLPLRWQRPRRVFVNSMSDLFHRTVPDDYIVQVFAVMVAAPQHTFQCLTKRHGRMRSLLSSPAFRAAVWAAVEDLDVPISGYVREPAPARWWPLPNVHLGVSVEDQQRATLRVDALRETPAAVRFLSCEPLLGPLDLCGCSRGPSFDGPDEDCPLHGRTRIDWVIVGGESGKGARPMHPAWARSLRDQCVSAGVPFTFKQWGEWRPVEPDVTANRREADWLVRADGYHWPLVEPHGAEDGTEVTIRRTGKHAAGRELDGRTWDQYPQAPGA